MLTFLRSLFRGTAQTGNVSSIYPFGSAFASAGTSVSVESALRCSAAFACIKVIAESVASLPLHLYERLNAGGKSRASKHPLYDLLHSAPNPEQTSYEWRELSVGHLLTYGNSYSEVERNGAGRPIALWPLFPANMTVSRKDGKLVYSYRHSGTSYTFVPAQILHVKAFGTNGLTGLSPIAQAAEAIGLSLATEEFEGRFFSNGANVGKVLEHPGRLTDDGVKRLRESFTALHGGLSNSHRVAILEEGMKLSSIGVPPKDAQFLELRQFQVGEIARIFRVPPHLIGDLSRATNSNIEMQSLEFVIHTLRPWLVRIEQAINRALLTDSERSKYFAEFAVEGLLRGDIKSRAEALQIWRQNGVINADEWRAIENMSPLPNGDGQVYITPLNMAPVQRPQTPTRSIEARDIQTGEQRAKSRTRIQQSFVPVLEDAVARIVRREVHDVGALAKKHLRDTTTLLTAIDDFYREHKEFVAKNIRSSVQALADAIAAELDDELSGQFQSKDEYRQFIEQYISTYATRYTASSLNQLRDVIDTASQNGTNPEDAINERLNEWTEKRPAKEAKNETTRISGAVARTIYLLAGVTKLVWHNSGGDSCPVCQDLNGRVVGIDQPFASAGDHIGDFSVSTNTHHPPIHRGCSCTISRA